MTDTTTPKTSPMWRVKYAEGNAGGTGSGGDWAYYERGEIERMKRDLLDAMLNADCGDGERYGHNRRNPFAAIFRRHRRPDLHADGMKWRRYRVIEVAYLLGDEWAPVHVSYTPPSVEIGEFQ